MYTRITSSGLILDWLIKATINVYVVHVYNSNLKGSIRDMYTCQNSMFAIIRYMYQNAMDHIEIGLPAVLNSNSISAQCIWYIYNMIMHGMYPGTCIFLW